MENSIATLGTVQFGLPYGINNHLGKPRVEDSLKILKYAYNHGINCFDTAFSYGDAEEILGKFIKENKLRNRVKIISKLRPNIFDDKLIEKDKYKIIKWEITKSLQKLGVRHLDGYLLHSPQYIFDKKIVEALQRCKKEGLIRNFGVSIYEEDEALYAVKNANVDYIQIPYSIFDTRLDKTKFFTIAKRKGIKVFARSAFIQGLIMMDGKAIPENLKGAKRYIVDFDKIIGKYGFSRVEAALLFSKCHAGIDQVVFGVDTIDQLQQDLKIMRKKYNFEPCYNELKKKFDEIEKSIIIPSLWAKKK